MARALYIHWPFCLAKCPYCDFNSHVRADVDEAAWQQALLADLRHEADLAGGEALDSIFFGGGTPSLMPPRLVASLIETATSLFGTRGDPEITLEANPSSVEAGRFADLAQAGVNRVSLGLQSLDDEALRFLGRLHDAAEGRAALDVAQRHFDRVSFDLIYALPGQTAAAWKGELERALSFGTGHLSLYQLTIEPGTRFATMARAGDFTPLADDAAADLFDLTREFTAAAGLPAYEVSNHARPGEESRHNLAYWRYQDYIGIGPGAHGRRGGFATVRHKKPENWLSAVEAARPWHRRSAQARGPGTGHRGVADGPAARRGRRSRRAFGPLRHSRAAADRAGQAGVLRRAGPRLAAKWILGGPMGERIGVTETGMPLLDALLGELVPATLAAA